MKTQFTHRNVVVCITFFAALAFLLSSCSNSHQMYRAQQSKKKSHGSYRYDSNPNFKGCKQNYRTLTCPN